MEEALRPIVDFRRYKIADSAAVREFYSLLRAAIKGAKGVGRIELLINDQTIPKIMDKMPYTDWREWATRRPDWLQQDVTTAFEGFVEKKWQDALIIAAAEPASWRGDGEKANAGVWPPDRTTGTSKGALKITGAVNVVEQGIFPRSHSPSWDVSFGRKCRARNLIGCDGGHVMLQCKKLMALELSERKEVLEKSGLCLFCLKHAAELECYGRGGMSKPRCTQPGCDGEHTPSVHKLMAEEHVGVNLVAEDEVENEDEDEDEDEDRDWEEDEGWWVGTVGAVEMPSQEEGFLRRVSERSGRVGVRTPTGRLLFRWSSRRWAVESRVNPTLLRKRGGRSPAPLGRMAPPQRVNRCYGWAPYGAIVSLHGHQAEEAEEEIKDHRGSRMGRGQAGCLA
jgi:hypothetical protein